ncbi:hypothetical protein [Rahnella sp. PCH160]|uniref:hypothetical protein n=1 Tax=Rahnella sp. PCH160 TaxID=3447928 RepID=UPI0039FC3E7E
MKLKIRSVIAVCFAVMMISACTSHKYDPTLDNQITAFQLKADQQFVSWTAQAMADNSLAAKPVVACQAAPVMTGQPLSLISPPSESDSAFFNSVETDLSMIELRTRILNNNPAIGQQMSGLRNIFYQIKYKRQHCSQYDSPAYINIQRKQISAILQAMLIYQLVLKNGATTTQN